MRGFLQVDYSFIELSFIALTDSVSSSLYTVGITGEFVFKASSCTDSFNTKEERATEFPVLHARTYNTGVWLKDYVVSPHAL